MAKINQLCVGESLVGDGNEVAHIDLIMGPRGSAAETAFANCLTNNKDGFTSLLAVVAPNLLAKPATVMFNKVTIKGAKQAVQMFGPAQHAVAKAVADSVAEGVIPADEADNLFVCVGVFIHWEATDDKKIQDYNYRAVKESIARAVADSVQAGVIPADEADNLFILVGVFIHWDAADDNKIFDYNYRATKESIERAVAGTPTAAEVTAKKGSVKHPFSPK